jgi:hypothetical protein
VTATFSIPHLVSASSGIVPRTFGSSRLVFWIDTIQMTPGLLGLRRLLLAPPSGRSDELVLHRIEPPRHLRDALALRIAARGPLCLVLRLGHLLAVAVARALAVADVGVQRDAPVEEQLLERSIHACVGEPVREAEIDSLARVQLLPLHQGIEDLVLLLLLLLLALHRGARLRRFGFDLSRPLARLGGRPTIAPGDRASQRRANTADAAAAAADPGRPHRVAHQAEVQLISDNYFAGLGKSS